MFIQPNVNYSVTLRSGSILADVEVTGLTPFNAATNLVNQINAVPINVTATGYSATSISAKVISTHTTDQTSTEVLSWWIILLIILGIIFFMWVLILSSYRPKYSYEQYEYV